MSGYYDTKVIFNIIDEDLYILDETSEAMDLTRSELIRQAIKCFIADFRIRQFKAEEELNAGDTTSAG